MAKNIDFDEMYTADFVDSRGIKWTIDMWSLHYIDECFLQINSFAISKMVTIEFKDLTDLIILLNGFDYIPQDLKIRCIKVYKNKMFL